MNFRYEWLWDVDEWTFRNGTATVSLSPNSGVVGNLPADLGIPLALFRSDGSPLMPISELRMFQAIYGSGTPGMPEAFCPVGTSILVGPTSAVSDSSCTLVHEKGWTALVNNTDVPLIPLGYHLALVHGGKAEGLKLKNIPLWESFDADFQAAITAMRRNFLAPTRGELTQAGAYRP